MKEAKRRHIQLTDVHGLVERDKVGKRGGVIGLRGEVKQKSACGGKEGNPWSRRRKFQGPTNANFHSVEG